MRGAYLGDTDFTVVGRIIPAYAGSTARLGGVCSLLADHPRVCGEHLDYKDFDGKHVGSSPRMRGALC